MSDLVSCPVLPHTVDVPPTSAEPPCLPPPPGSSIKLGCENGLLTAPHVSDQLLKRRRLEDGSIATNSTDINSISKSTVTGPPADTSASQLPASVTNANNRRLVNLLPKDVLVDLIVRATSLHPDVAQVADQALENCAPCRRLMVRNVNFLTENAAFHQVFSRLGPVEDYTIVRDKETRRSKGFGFVTFKCLSSVRAALSRPISLDGRELQIKLAAGNLVELPLAASEPSSYSYGSSSNTSPGSLLPPVPHSNMEMGNDKLRRKLFIRNLSDMTTTDRLKSAFREFGEMEDCVAVTDHFTGRSKGYGFATFVKAEDAAKAVQNSQRVIDGQMTFVTYAAPESGHRQNRDSNRVTSIAPPPLVSGPGGGPMAPGPPVYGYMTSAQANPHQQYHPHVSQNAMYYSHVMRPTQQQHHQQQQQQQGGGGTMSSVNAVPLGGRPGVVGPMPTNGDMRFLGMEAYASRPQQSAGAASSVSQIYGQTVMQQQPPLYM